MRAIWRRRRIYFTRRRLLDLAKRYDAQSKPGRGPRAGRRPAPLRLRQSSPGPARPAISLSLVDLRNTPAVATTRSIVARTRSRSFNCGPRSRKRPIAICVQNHEHSRSRSVCHDGCFENIPAPGRPNDERLTHRWDRSCVLSWSDDVRKVFVVALSEQDSSAPLRSGIVLVACPPAHGISQAALVLEGRANTPVSTPPKPPEQRWAEALPRGLRTVQCGRTTRHVGSSKRIRQSSLHTEFAHIVPAASRIQQEPTRLILWR